MTRDLNKYEEKESKKARKGYKGKKKNLLLPLFIMQRR